MSASLWKYFCKPLFSIRRTFFWGSDSMTSIPCLSRMSRRMLQCSSICSTRPTNFGITCRPRHSKWLCGKTWTSYRCIGVSIKTSRNDSNDISWSIPMCCMGRGGSSISMTLLLYAAIRRSKGLRTKLKLKWLRRYLRALRKVINSVSLFVSCCQNLSDVVFVPLGGRSLNSRHKAA